MATKSKEELQKEINEKRTLRAKQVAQLKAQNELLQDEKRRAAEKWGEGSDKTQKLFKDIDFAIGQNLERGMEYLGVSENEINAAQYNEPDPAEVAAYYERLERKESVKRERNVKMGS